MPKSWCRLLLIPFVAIAVGASVASAAGAADGVDLSGTFKGLFFDKGRNIRLNNFRMRLKHTDDRIEGQATDNTVFVTGIVVESRVFLEWEHASGNHGEGVWEILEDGNRLKGTWDSKGSGRFYGIWDLRRQ